MSVMVRIGGPFFMSAQRAARAVIYLATSPDLAQVSGKFFSKGKEAKSSEQSYDAASAERLWKVSAELTRLESKPSLTVS